MSSLVTEAVLEKKFSSVSNTQDSIQTLSLWLLHHKAHHQKIVNTWLKVLKKDKVNHRLTLFYLANDVIQNCKRKNVSFFKDAFAEVLKEATLHVRDEQIRKSVDRVFKIWEERSVYESDFIADLQGILIHAKASATASSKLIANFKSEKVVEKIRAVKMLEVEISTKLSSVNLSKLNSSNAEIVQKLKDRKHGQTFSREFEENSRSLDELVKTSSKEIDERTELIELLGQSEVYYTNQRSEVKMVANAYKNFATRVKTLQKKLEDMMPTFESPIPSPCPDAPSPTNSEDEAELNLPENEEKQNDSDLEKSASSSISSISKPTASSIGNPIPTVSNLFTQEPGSMTSWLDTFTKKTNSPTISTSANAGNQKDNISLDSRLSNLLQNIPNLPSGLQNTLFGASLTDNSESVTNSPASVRKGNNLFQSSDTQTPVKDEYSGQNTPLQDEDTPSTGASFFSRLAAAPKASQSPKEILKGLKDFIQNASSMSNEKSHVIHDNSLSWPSDKSEPTEKVNISETGKAVSRFSEVSSNFPASVYESPQYPLPSTTIETSLAVNNNNSALKNVSTNFSQISFSDTLTYTPMQSSSETSISQSIHQNLSFIPTLVPSTPTANTFSFHGDNSYNAYSSEIQNFETDMDIESGDDDSLIATDVERDHLSDKVGDSLPRQSALITLVTDNGTMGSPPEKKNKAFDDFSKSDKHHFHETKRRRFSDSKPGDFPESKQNYLPETNREFSDASSSYYPKIDQGHFPETSKGSFPESSAVPFSEADKGYFSADRDQFLDSGQVHFADGDKNPFLESDRPIFSETERGSFLEPIKDAFSEPDRRPALELDGTSFSKPDGYLTSMGSSYPEGQSDWPINSLQPESILPPSALPEIKQITSPADCNEQDGLNEAYFLSTPPPPIESNFPNGQRGMELPVNTVSVPLSKIETVQSHRTATVNNWDKPDWNNFEFDKREHFGERGPPRNSPMEYHDYHHKKQFNAPWPRFPPQNRWTPPQYRPPPSFDHGPRPPRQFPPFPPRGRGRGWNRHPRPQY